MWCPRISWTFACGFSVRVAGLDLFQGWSASGQFSQDRIDGCGPHKRSWFFVPGPQKLLYRSLLRVKDASPLRPRKTPAPDQACPSNLHPRPLSPSRHESEGRLREPGVQRPHRRRSGPGSLEISAGVGVRECRSLVLRLPDRRLSRPCWRSSRQVRRELAPAKGVRNCRRSPAAPLPCCVRRQSGARIHRSRRCTAGRRGCQGYGRSGYRFRSQSPPISSISCSARQGCRDFASMISAGKHFGLALKAGHVLGVAHQRGGLERFYSTGLSAARGP